MKKVALIGNPNCGKTTLFNSLTGSNARVGNWAGVTVEKREGVCKKHGAPMSIVDLPGIYSLSPYTPEEVVSRNFILEEKPDCVLNIIDATNLERNLYLTTQLMELDVPIVIALNMMDIVEKSGDKIDIKLLETQIGAPIVEISALKEKGFTALMSEVYKASLHKRMGDTVLKDSVLAPIICEVKGDFEKKNMENSLFHAIKLIELDEIEVKNSFASLKMIDEYKKTFKNEDFGEDFEAIIADSRYGYITKNLSSCLKKKRANSEKATTSDKIDKALTHRFWGIPIFLMILFVIFHFTFSENFLFLGAALGEDFVTLQNTALEGVFGEGGINSFGVILQSLMGVFCDWIGGFIAAALSGAPTWVSGLLVNGVWGGIASVASFIPQILLLLVLFSALEDSGYMARVAFILDRIFRKFGLSGRAFMPMIMGFGCSIPAMLNTRTLADENERVATIRVIPFFSCGAKLPILTAIGGGIVAQFGVGNADLITYGMYLLGIVTAIVSVIIMRFTTMKGEVSPFIMELPAYHAPQFSSLMKLLWDKAKHFVKKAFTIILASTIIIWVVSHFSFSWSYLSDTQIDQSILANIGKLVQPIFTPLGFGSQLGAWGWVFVVAAVSGLIAKENVIATFGALAACIVAGFDPSGGEGVESVVALIAATGITVPALIAFIAFNMTTIPCFAAVATAKAELRTKKKFNFTLLFWAMVSYIIATMIFLVGSWWWTAFIFAGVIALAIVFIALYNKKSKIKLEKK